MKGFVESTLRAIENFDEAQQCKRAADHPVVIRLRGKLQERLVRILDQMPLVPIHVPPELQELWLVCDDGLELLRTSQRRLIKRKSLQQLHVCLQLVSVPDMESEEWRAGAPRFEL